VCGDMGPCPSGNAPQGLSWCLTLSWRACYSTEHWVPPQNFPALGLGEIIYIFITFPVHVDTGIQGRFGKHKPRKQKKVSRSPWSTCLPTHLHLRKMFVWTLENLTEHSMGPCENVQCPGYLGVSSLGQRVHRGSRGPRAVG
jgi:hypothetical protein